VDFHSGELAVQERIGVRHQAAKIGGSRHDAVPPAAKAFLEQRRFVVLATADFEGRPWASLLTGTPGFASSPDPLTVRIHAGPVPGDPLAVNVGSSRFAGLLAIDLATRRRMRVNGVLEREPEGEIVIRVEQTYSNCPKYIQRRRAEREDPALPARLVRRTATLAPEQLAWLRRADTFFIATLNPAEGADASHRGGMPGFLRAEGDRLVWPDYAGNMMYNTLGNIAVHPRAGLVVPDFSTGSIMQLTGRAEILWSGGDVPGAERRVQLEVEDVVEITGVLPANDEVEYSPFNPPQT
jgi:uncharacterized protein